jgi:hypothetical protein
MRKRYEIDVVINDVPENPEKKIPEPPPKPKKREFVARKRITINGHRFTKSTPYYFGHEESLNDVHFWLFENPETGECAYTGFPHFEVFEKVSEIYDDQEVLFYYGTRNGRLYLIEASTERYVMHDMGLLLNWNRKPRPYHICQERVNRTLTGR